MLRWVFAVTLFALAFTGSPAGGQGSATPGAPQPGVSASLAQERARRLSDLRYNLSFSIPANRHAPIDVPAEWETVANGVESSRVVRGDRTYLTFAETQPIATYLFAFATGKFTIERAERRGRSFRMFHRETDREKVARNREAVFDLHAT